LARTLTRQTRTTMAITPIDTHCRRCGEDFHLSELRHQRTGTCPRDGWSLTPDWTGLLLDQARPAEAAEAHLVRALRNLRNLAGNLVLRPHTVLRNLF